MLNVLTLLISTLLSVQNCPLVPNPMFSEAVGETFTLHQDVRIIYDKEFRSSAEFLQGELHRYLDVTSILADVHPDRASEGIVLRVGSCSTNPEHYSIDMNSECVVIEAATESGFINGMMSFIQLARLSQCKDCKIVMDCWKIRDEPRYEWRGFMLDEARHFFGKEKVKQLLDWMSFYHLNKFHWHLSDTQGWRIVINKYPRLANVGGIGECGNPDAPAKFYTQDDIREIVSYASARSIEIIPEIDMPGHASAAVRAYPEYNGGGKKSNPTYTFNPAKDETYSFLSDILSEVDVLFPSQIIHIGGDEVDSAHPAWEINPDIQNLRKSEGLETLKDVETYFCCRIADSLYKRNNKVAVWDEMADSELDRERTIMFFWRPQETEQLQKALDKGYPVVFCPDTPMYFNYANDTTQVHGVPWKKLGPNYYWQVYDFECTAYDVKYPADSRILGVQANLWTERVWTGNRLDYLLFPRIAALAETAWTAKENKNLDDFNDRLVMQFELYRKDEVYFYNPFDKSEIGEPVK